MQHGGHRWFRLKPDLLAHRGDRVLVMDTKWKLLHDAETGRKGKYGLLQSDFYQMHAYGHTYLPGAGDMLLIYPETEQFTQPLPPFEFHSSQGLRLWVAPFCLHDPRLLLPPDGPLGAIFAPKEERR